MTEEVQVHVSHDARCVLLTVATREGDRLNRIITELSVDATQGLIDRLKAELANRKREARAAAKRPK